MKKLLTPVLASFAGLALLACGASPEAVCDHTIELTKKELGDEAAKAIDRAACISSAERRKEMKGMMKYRTEANCVMDAQKLDELIKCAEAKD